MHETFEHTADLGLRANAASLDELFAEMARCLTGCLVDDAATIRPLTATTIEIAGHDRDYLLFDWLRELLYRFDAEGTVFGSFEVSVRDDGLTARVAGEPFDAARHGRGREVKAITYHELLVEPTADGWLAEVIVDI